MLEYFLDDVLVFNAGHDAYGAPTGRTRLDINPKHPFQALRPGHGDNVLSEQELYQWRASRRGNRACGRCVNTGV